MDNLSFSDYFSDFILFDVATFKEKTYPQSLSSIVLFGSPSSVTQGIASLSKDPIFTHDEMMEFPSIEEYTKTRAKESKEKIIEFGLLIILTLIIISGNYFNEIKKEISIRKWVGNSYFKTILSFVTTCIFSLITGGLAAFLMHAFSYYLLKVNILQRPYVEVWSLFILIGTIIFIVQTAYISFIYLFTTALAFLKGAEE